MNTIKIEKQGFITIITLNRPEKRNAINLEMSREIQQAFQEFDDSEQRVAIITGAGDKAFSAGADLHEFPELWRCVPSIGIKTNKPIIAAVDGWAVGGGLIIPLYADFCVATENAKFDYPEGKVGLTGGLIAGLAARISHKAAMDIMVLGRTVSGRRAYEMGLVTDCVEAGKHMEHAIKMAERLCDMAPMVVTHLKEVVNSKMLNKAPAEEMMRAKMKADEIWNSKDFEEGKRAFFEKRKPNFIGQ